MKGLFIPCGGSDAPDCSTDSLRLMFSHPDMEIMRQTLSPEAAVWLTPATDKTTLEFFYVLSGQMRITLNQEQERIIRAGGCFYADGLEQDVLMKADALTQLLYITNRRIFDSASGFVENLKQILLQIDEKDHYTRGHSLNVMRYVSQLMTCFASDDFEQTADDIMTAALFHDVGKCRTPDAILKKVGRLTEEEMRVMRRHPIDTAEMLRGKFSEAVVDIALHHHERLDGGGYPDGLRAEELSLPARILSVADSFDAMTSKRVYNRPKTFEQAALEMCDMPEQYDRRVTEALSRLVREGKLSAASPADEATLGRGLSSGGDLPGA